MGLQASLGALSGAERGSLPGADDDNDSSPTGPHRPPAPKNTVVFGSQLTANLANCEGEGSQEQNTGFVLELEGTLRALNNLPGFSNTAAGQQAMQQLSDSLFKLGATGGKFQDDSGYPGG